MCVISVRGQRQQESRFKKIMPYEGAHLGAYISVDIAVFINCPSRQGYRYVVTFVDHATKMLWSYPHRCEVACIGSKDQTLSRGRGKRIDQQ